MKHDLFVEMDRLGIRYRFVGTDLKITPPIPPDLLEELRGRKHEIVAEVEQRITVFRQQRREWHEIGQAGEPYYVLYDAIEFKPGTCVSCGGDKGARPPDMPPAAIHLRCRTCVAAIEIVLGEDSEPC